MFFSFSSGKHLDVSVNSSILARLFINLAFWFWWSPEKKRGFQRWVSEIIFRKRKKKSSNVFLKRMNQTYYIWCNTHIEELCTLVVLCTFTSAGCPGRKEGRKRKRCAEVRGALRHGLHSGEHARPPREREGSRWLAPPSVIPPEHRRIDGALASTNCADPEASETEIAFLT